jgi:hypothetical protein
MSDELSWLMEWYVAQCDEDWEHRFGLEIGTLDNPGWSLTIDFNSTPYEGRSFDPVSYNVSNQEALDGPAGDKSWWDCRIEGSTFKAFGGPRDLANLIAVFRSWIDDAGG